MIFYSPLDYIKIDIANQFGATKTSMGLDKKQFEERIQWVHDNETQLEQLVDQADDKTKYRYISAVMAYREVQADKPTGHLVGLDACASGPQIMSALTRDPIGARNTNLIGNQRNDVYTVTTDTMNMILGNAVTYERKQIKMALMPYFYGSKKRPKEVFGDGTPEYLAFYEAQEKVCPGASALLPIMVNAWQPWAKEHCYTLSDGFEARVKVTDVVEKKIEIDELDHATFKYRYEVNQGTEEGVALAANIIQAIDGMIVREMNRRCNHDKGKLSVVCELLKQRTRHRHLKGVHLDSIQTIWKDHHFTSLVDVENLDEDDIKTFDFNYCEALIKLIIRTLSRPSFPVIMIHKSLWM